MELDDVLTSIAESLREERVRAGLTLEQLALRSELSMAHLSRWSRETDSPPWPP